MFSSRFYLLVALLSVALFSPVLAQATGNIGVTFNQVIDDRSGGLVSDYEYDGDGFDIEIDGLLQIGDIYRGKVHGEIVFDVSAVGIKVATDITGKGYTLETMGRDQNVTLGLTVPVGDLNFDVGIGGKNASPWAVPNALDELLPKGYNESKMEALGLQNFYPDPKGIPFQHGNFFETYVATGLKKSNVDIELKGIFQVVGQGDKAHQIRADFQTTRRFLGIVNATLGWQLAAMFYQNTVHYESAFFTSFGFPF